LNPLVSFNGILCHLTRTLFHSIINAPHLHRLAQLA
jgi:hypothetical protein